jgi:hypothetical protein
MEGSGSQFFFHPGTARNRPFWMDDWHRADWAAWPMRWHFSPAQTHEAGLVRRLRLCAVAGHGLSSQLSAKGPYAEIPQARLDTAWQAGRAVCEQSMGPIS